MKQRLQEKNTVKEMRLVTIAIQMRVWICRDIFSLIYITM